MNDSRVRIAVTPPLLLVFLTGCGGGGSDARTVVRGKFVEGEKPFVLDKSKIKLPPGARALPPGVEPLSVVFISAETGEQFPATATADTGTFEVTGPDGKGIKSGRYKVAVTAGVGGADYFGGKYAPESTQIVRDVKPGEEVVIDLSKPQG